MTTKLKFKYAFYGMISGIFLQMINVTYLERKVKLRKEELKKLNVINGNTIEENILKNEKENFYLIFYFLFDCYTEYLLRNSLIYANKIMP